MYVVYVHVYVYAYVYVYVYVYVYSTRSFVGLDPWGLDPGAWKKPKFIKIRSQPEES